MAMPSAPLIRAILINSATPLAQMKAEYPAPGAASVIKLGVVPSMYQGFGRVNLPRMLKMQGDDYAIQLQDRVTLTTTDQTKTFSIPIKPGQACFATLVWNDPPPYGNSKRALVNDLDLTVQLAGKTYFANGRGGYDSVNVVEKVATPAVVDGGECEVTIKVGKGTNTHYRERRI